MHFSEVRSFFIPNCWKTMTQENETKWKAQNNVTNSMTEGIKRGLAGALGNCHRILILSLPLSSPPKPTDVMN